MDNEMSIEYEDFEVISAYSNNEVRDSHLYLLAEAMGPDDFNEGYQMAKKILLNDAKLTVKCALRKASEK